MSESSSFCQSSLKSRMLLCACGVAPVQERQGCAQSGCGCVAVWFAVVEHKADRTRGTNNKSWRCTKERVKGTRFLRWSRLLPAFCRPIPTLQQ